MTDTFDAACAELRRAQEAWRLAVAAIDHVRAEGAHSAAIASTIAAGLKAGGPRALSATETQALQDLRDSTTAMELAVAAEVAAQHALSAAQEEYTRLEFGWVSLALSNYGAGWSRRVEARRG